MNQDDVIENAFEEEPIEHRPPPRNSNSTLIVVLSIVAGACLMMIICVGILAALFLPAVSSSRLAARRMQSKNNLKQIGLAMHNYHDTYIVFPPGATVDQTGTSHHSWMTQLLPFLDQAHLSNGIDFDNPWDDPDNLLPFSSEIPTFLNPEIADRITVDGLGMSHYAGNVSVLFNNSRIRIRDITDGTSNTIMGGEIKENLPAWGDPSNQRDLSLGINKNSHGFGGPYPGGANMIMLDGSVRFISESTNPDTLRKLGTHNDGEVVPQF